MSTLNQVHSKQGDVGIPLLPSSLSMKYDTLCKTHRWHPNRESTISFFVYGSRPLFVVKQSLILHTQSRTWGLQFLEYMSDASHVHVSHKNHTQ